MSERLSFGGETNGQSGRRAKSRTEKEREEGRRTNRERGEGVQETKRVKSLFNGVKSHG